MFDLSQNILHIVMYNGAGLWIRDKLLPHFKSVIQYKTEFLSYAGLVR